MDTELAKTFLAVVSAGSFIEAASRLHVTQSTTSTRIQRLEETLGASLFVRNKAGTTLTPAGRKFQYHASLLTRTVERARQEVGIVSGYDATLTVSGRIGLWEDLLAGWLPVFAAASPDVAVRAMIGFEDDLMQSLVEGGTDIAIMYSPHAQPSLVIELLLEEKLVMVSSNPNSPPQPGRDYIFVDWGPEFYARHSLAFPDFCGAGMTFNIGWLGLRHLLSRGGTGYFPARLVRQHEASGKIFRIKDAPEFRHPAYLCYPANQDCDYCALALDSIRQIASEYA